MTQADVPSDRDSPEGSAGEPFRILFVCTGNTCRSPLAEAIARRELQKRGWRHVEVRSAGVAAELGGVASDGSVQAAVRHGLDLSQHRTAPLSADLLEWADIVLTMSPGHLAGVVAHGAGEKASVVTDFVEGREPEDHPRGPGVLDPVGGDDHAYEATYLELDDLVRRALARLAPLVRP